ncbi:MAG: transposase [Myxococcales bacterium]
MQTELPFHSWGGRRKGSGRKRGTRASHHARPRFARPTPVHVTARVREHVWNLRSRRCHLRIARCLEGALGRFGLRVIEYSVLGNHLHLIVEADGSESLSRGIQGLSIRIAKALNALMSAQGSVFADHYDARLLTTPTQLVRAIAYVLNNHRHHYAASGLDPYSSVALTPEQRRARLAMPVSWLLKTGWRRASPKDRDRLGGSSWH